MPTVTISARNFALPPVCVCCGAAPDRSFNDSGSHDAQRPRGDKAIAFPVCSRCFAHRERETSILRVLDSGDGRGPNCEARGALVDFVSWRGTEATIAFGSPSYAAAFVAANQAAGVRVLRYHQGGEPRPTSRFAALPIVVIAVTVALVSRMCDDACRASRHDVQPAPVAAPRTGPASPASAEGAAAPPVARTHPHAHHRAAHDGGAAPRTKVCRDSRGAAVEVPREMPCRDVGADEPDGASPPALPPVTEPAPTRRRRSSSSPPSAPAPSSGPVQVQGYYRRDGTYVHGYTRRR